MGVTWLGQPDCDAERGSMCALGISNTGDSAEELFRQLTGATKAPQAALGDAVLCGQLIEVKKASSKTLNQVRAVKYIPLVAYYERGSQWYVVPANEIVRQCARKARGQHTENPFESATLSITNLAECAVEDPTHLRDRVCAAIEEADELGAIRLGAGPRPRLRFDPAVVRERWASVNAPPPVASTRRRRPATKLHVVPTDDLLEFDSDD